MQYFNQKQKLNFGQALWYLYMLEWISHIHCRPECKIGKPDGLSRGSEEEKSGINAHFFDKKHLLDLKNDHIAEEADLEDMEIARIDVATLEKKNRLWVVLLVHRLKVL